MNSSLSVLIFVKSQTGTLYGATQMNTILWYSNIFTRLNRFLNAHLICHFAPISRLRFPG